MLFSMSLQAIDIARNCHRSYRVVVERDLLGDCLVSLTYGRVGAAGRTIVTIARDEEHARQITKVALRRRASAPRRIGVRYRPVAQFAASGWQNLSEELTKPPFHQTRSRV